MAISIGRLRPDTQYDYKFVCLSHNTLRGAAGGAVLLAELLCAEGYITREVTYTCTTKETARSAPQVVRFLLNCIEKERFYETTASSPASPPPLSRPSATARSIWPPLTACSTRKLAAGIDALGHLRHDRRRLYALHHRAAHPHRPRHPLRLRPLQGHRWLRLQRHVPRARTQPDSIRHGRGRPSARHAVL